MINFLLFVLFFLISYFIVRHWYVDSQVSKFKKRDSVQEFAKENSLRNFFSKFNFIKTKENFLFLQGNPLNLNAISYYMLKIFLALLLCMAGIINYKSYIIAIILAVFGFGFIDIYISIRRKSRNEEICTDLLSITNSISMQLSAYVPLKDSLKNQYENCKNKDFKKAIMIFSTKYELSEFNIDAALNELNSRFDIIELDMFCNTIRQYNKVGNIIELLDNLSSILKEKYVEKLKSNTREKVIYITFGVILALTNIVLITFYPLFVSVGNNFNKIFN